MCSGQMCIVSESLGQVSFRILLVSALYQEFLSMLSTKTMEDKGPRFVDVSYKINCISHIDSVTSTYYVDVKLFFHWIDPKFIGRKKNESVDIKTEGAWNPDIVVSNEHQLTSVDNHRDIKVNNSATGELKSSVQYRGTLFINVSLANTTRILL